MHTFMYIRVRKYTLYNRYPVILRQFSLNHGTGGAGQFRGGNGVIRELQFRKPLTLAILASCFFRVALYFFLLSKPGGDVGKKGDNTFLRRDGTVENLGGKAKVDMLE